MFAMSTSKLWWLLVAWVAVPSAHSHGLGFHAADGEPGATPDFPDITGPFEVEVSFMFQDFDNRVNQRLFDFCDPSQVPLIAVGQFTGTSQLMLEIVTTTGDYLYAITSAGNPVSTNVRTTVRAGVESSGQIWIELEGQPRDLGDVIADLTQLNGPKSQKQIGKSCFSGTDDDLLGSVTDLRISPYGASPYGVEQQRFQNRPAQIFGPFTISFWARMDTITTLGQTFFEFSNGANTNDILMGNYGLSDEMQFCVWAADDSAWNCVLAGSTIVEGEVALWHVGVKADGTMWMEKEGEITGYWYFEEPASYLYPVEWKNEIRAQMLLGDTNFVSAEKLNGFILGLRVDGIAMS